MAHPAYERTRAILAARLGERRSELEEAVLARVQALADPREISDPEYAHGLRVAVAAAVGYGLDSIASGESRAPAVPTALLAQARLAARNGVSLETVLRRYFAGYSLLSDRLIDACGAEGLSGSDQKLLLRAQAALLDRLLATISVEYNREFDARPGSSDERRARHIEGLLAGELLDTSELGYDLDGHHLGAVTRGQGSKAAGAIRDLAKRLGTRGLVVRRQEDVVWAWFGSSLPLDGEELGRLIYATWPPHLPLGIGEPAEGQSGWRLTHRQARATFPIACRGPKNYARYADVALVATLRQDDLLVTSLRELYLTPLEGERDGGILARETLRAYFAAKRNVSSAAAALGLNRNTVATRLRAIEATLGTSLDSRAMDLEAALRIEELGEHRPGVVR